MRRLIERVIIIAIVVFIGLLIFGPAPIKEKCRNVVDQIIGIFVKPDSSQDKPNFGESLKDKLLD